MKYVVCPKCGSHLDHGERCSCEKDKYIELEAFKIRDSTSYLMAQSGGRVDIRTTGQAVVLTGPNGEKLKAYPCKNVRNGIHALSRVDPGCHVVKAVEYTFGYPTVIIYRVEKFKDSKDGSRAVCKRIYEDNGELPADVEEQRVGKFLEAIAAAIYTTEDMGCLKAHYTV